MKPLGREGHVTGHMDDCSDLPEPKTSHIQIISAILRGLAITFQFGKIVAIGALKILCLDKSDFCSYLVKKDLHYSK